MGYMGYMGLEMGKISSELIFLSPSYFYRVAMMMRFLPISSVVFMHL